MNINAFQASLNAHMAMVSSMPPSLPRTKAKLESTLNRVDACFRAAPSLDQSFFARALEPVFSIPDFHSFSKAMVHMRHSLFGNPFCISENQIICRSSIEAEKAADLFSFPENDIPILVRGAQPDDSQEEPGFDLDEWSNLADKNLRHIYNSSWMDRGREHLLMLTTPFGSTDIVDLQPGQEHSGDVNMFYPTTINLYPAAIAREFAGSPFPPEYLDLSLRATLVHEDRHVQHNTGRLAGIFFEWNKKDNDNGNMIATKKGPYPRAHLLKELDAHSEEFLYCEHELRESGKMRDFSSMIFMVGHYANLAPFMKVFELPMDDMPEDLRELRDRRKEDLFNSKSFGFIREHPPKADLEL